MYDLIFYYIYRQQINKGNGKFSARYNASIIVFIAISIHVGVILAIIRETIITGELAKDSLFRNKGLQALFALGFVHFVYRLFTYKRIEKIENKYSESKFFESYGGWMTAALIFIPMLAFIIILS